MVPDKLSKEYRMPEDADLIRPGAAVPSHIQQISSDLRTIGRISFWLQLVLGVISAVLLSFGTLILLSSNQRTKGIEVGILAAIAGVVILAIAIFFTRRYMQYSKDILSPDPKERPKKKDTLQLIKTGLIFNLVGMLLTIFGAEALVGIILQKSLLIPQATITADPNKFINSADVLIVQANTNSIAAHFAGLVCSLWLLNRVIQRINL
jgi:hypothetical protein